MIMPSFKFSPVIHSVDLTNHDKKPSPLVTCLTSSSVSSFVNVMSRWIVCPEYSIPPISHADILSADLGDEDSLLYIDIKTSDEAEHEQWFAILVKQMLLLLEDTTLQLIRVHRRLFLKSKIPMQSLDEYIHISKMSNEGKTFGVELRFSLKRSSYFSKDKEFPSALPFFYPNLEAYCYNYYNQEEENIYTNKALAIIGISVIPYQLTTAEDIQRLEFTFGNQIIKKLLKWCSNTENGYKKRVPHGLLVPVKHCKETFRVLKVRHGHWAKTWTEKTDAAKFVFEDLAIASFLMNLMKSGNGKGSTCNSFVDLGCGNGFLVHILTEEGYSGKGIDLSKRKIWDEYPNSNLEVKTIYPMFEKYPNVDWIIGNHPDELAPWIPIIAHHSGYQSNFIIIPCCFYTLSGERFIHNKPRKSYQNTALENLSGKYLSYIEYLEEICDLCGYIVEYEFLLIPSTKNLALVCRHRKIKKEEENLITEKIAKVLSSIKFKARLSDREKQACIVVE